MSGSSAPRQTLTYLTRRFAEAGIRPNARHGQNFLIDLNLLGVLVESAQVGPDDVVLEIGAGTGSLTQMLCARAAAVVSVEIDPHMFQFASEATIDCPNVELLKLDALKNKNRLNPLVLEAVQRQLDLDPRRQFKLVANLPYSVATPILSNLLSAPQPPRSMTVTIQKELGDRLLASPGSKDYGALSVWVQCQCRGELLRVLPPAVFWPKPKVHSAFVQLTLDPPRRSQVPHLEFFHHWVRALFLHRRKFLRSVVHSACQGRLDKPAVDQVLAELGLSESLRAEELSIAQMIALCEAVRARWGDDGKLPLQ